MVEVIGFTAFEPFKVFIAAIFIYVLVFAILKKVGMFGESNGINSIIALITAIIVSFSGVIVYAISYALSWFVIILFIVFMLMLLLLFLGVDMKKIGDVATHNGRYIVIAFVLIFGVIIVKSFFALNNSFDTNEPINGSYEVDPSFNTGVDDVTNSEINEETFMGINLNNEWVSLALFFIVLGIFISLVGR